MDPTDDRCRNPGCRCPRTDDSEYCSAACARAALGDIGPADCGCGHAGCAAAPGGG